MLPIFNERQYAKKMLNGIADDREQEDKRKYSYRELLIYAKWLRNLLHQETEEVQDQYVYNGMITFCEQLQLHFDIDLDYYMIEGLVKYSKKYKLRDCKPSYISKNEWFDILTIPTEEARRIYFACLILGKFNRNNPVTIVGNTLMDYEDKRLKLKYSIKDICKYANVKFKREDLKNNPNLIKEPFYLLYKMGFIDTVPRKQTYIILNKADLTVDSSEAFLHITHYDEIDKYYKYALNQKGYKICTTCGKPFYTNSCRTTTCSDCHEKHLPEHFYTVCSCCGTRFEKKSKYDSRTTMCNKCYNQKRKKDKAETMKRLRNN